jgi:hypothetical protein
MMAGENQLDRRLRQLEQPELPRPDSSSAGELDFCSVWRLLCLYFARLRPEWCEA